MGASLPGVLEERVKDQAGNPIATYQYVYGLDLISRIDATSSTHYLSDGLGSTTGVTSSSGSVTDTYTYDVFGATRSHAGPSVQPFRFTGEQQDPDANRQLYYLRARYYDPALGRFWSRDPIPSLQSYGYVGANPVNFVDPYGLNACGPLGGVCDAAGAVGGYVADKSQDFAYGLGHCVAGIHTCPHDAITFALSLTCTGDRNTGPAGWVYYENTRGGCEWMFGVSDATCYTPGFITFCAAGTDPGLRCHEYQHYVQSRLIPYPFYWLVAAEGMPGERDATAAGQDKESRLPFTPVRLPGFLQCG